MKRYCLLIVVTIALAACASAVPPTSTPIPSVMTPAVSPVEIPAVSPVATPVAPPELSGVAPTATSDRVATFPNTIIVYQREGGITGKAEKWTIYPTGRIVAGDGTEWQVPAEQVAPLFTLVESSGFKSLNAKYPVTSVCADCYVHTLTVYGQAEPQTVTFVDGADLPAHLQQVLSEIDKAIVR